MPALLNAALPISTAHRPRYRAMALPASAATVSAPERIAEQRIKAVAINMTAGCDFTRHAATAPKMHDGIKRISRNMAWVIPFNRRVIGGG